MSKLESRETPVCYCTVFNGVDGKTEKIIFSYIDGQGAIWTDHPLPSLQAGDRFEVHGDVDYHKFRVVKREMSICPSTDDDYYYTFFTFITLELVTEKDEQQV